MRRKTYTPEFRAEAVRRLLTSDKSAKDLGQELGVSDCSLLNWKRQVLHNGDHPPQSKPKGVRISYSVLEEENIRLKKELAVARHAREILKKIPRHTFSRPFAERHAVISNLATEYPKKDLCRALQVSRSGDYKWRCHLPGPRAQANEQLLRHIQQAHAHSRETYGSPQLTRQLKRQNIACTENRVARLMKRQGIRAQGKRPFRPRTTDSHHQQQPAANRLKELGPPARLDQTWVADITYIRTLAGWVYLAAVMDLCSRKIVGWSISYSLETTLVKEALRHALAVRRPAAGLLHHSDRGIQYASSAFQALLCSFEIIPSMSGRGNCYDNAAMESFWRTLKTEMIHRQDFQDLTKARFAIFVYVETFYNRRRLHSALDYQPPVEFEQQLTNHKN